MLYDDRPPGPAQPVIRLRVLQTTDLHMHLPAYDYDLIQPSGVRGLANLRHDIRSLRDTDIPTLLFDTGDFLQGSPLADVAVQTPGRHPMITAFNDLQYDAVVLGNHDFDYGLTVLRDALHDLNCPVVAANIALDGGPRIAQPSTLIEVADAGETLTVGVIGLTTQETYLVQRAPDDPVLSVSDPVIKAQAELQQLRDQGADIVVALCHFGICERDGADNVAPQIAAIPGIDAVLCGHSHDVFPGPDISETADIAPEMGRLHGKPAMMAGAFGSHLGVMDLSVSKAPDGWHIQDADVRMIKAAGNATRPLPLPLEAMQAATIERLNAPLAQTRVPLSNVFGLIQPDLTQQLLADARIAAIITQLAGTDVANFPVLATTSAYRIGGKDHPFGFVNVPSGPMTRKTAHAIYPFQDPVVAVRRNAGQIKDWLERSAAHFLTIQPGGQNQALIPPHMPPYRFKTIYGVTYQIDVSAAPGDRIRALSYQGTTLSDDAVFIVATAAFQANEMGFEAENEIVAISDETSQEIMANYLASQTPLNPVLRPVWDFVPLPNTTAVIATSPAATADMTDRTVVSQGPQPNGLQQFILTFD
jgi:2',3'-cyclic-nucleotide 2'-phosphodiesterase/3'-nucleotidase